MDSANNPISLTDCHNSFQCIDFGKQLSFRSLLNHNPLNKTGDMSTDIFVGYAAIAVFMAWYSLNVGMVMRIFRG